MSKLIWDVAGEKFYETGTKKATFYKQVDGAYPEGIAWSGVTAISETPSGAEASPFYADDIKYLELMSKEELGGTITAYYYPDEWAECDGSAALNGIAGVMMGQQPRAHFGLAFQTVLGNDSEMDKYAYKLHLIYNALASVSARDYKTIGDSPEPNEFSWEFTTTPVPTPDGGVTSNLTIDSSKIAEGKKKNLKVLEAVLFGSDAFSATMTYAVGDVVEKENKLYTCKTAVTTPGTWSENSWDEVQNVSVGPRLPMPIEVASIFA